MSSPKYGLSEETESDWRKRLESDWGRTFSFGILAPPASPLAFMWRKFGVAGDIMLVVKLCSLFHEPPKE